MTFEEFLDKWVTTDSFSMLDKQCSVTFSTSQLVISTKKREVSGDKYVAAFILPHQSSWVEHLPMCDFSDCDKGLTIHFGLGK